MTAGNMAPVTPPARLKLFGAWSCNMWLISIDNDKPKTFCASQIFGSWGYESRLQITSGWTKISPGQRFCSGVWTLIFHQGAIYNVFRMTTRLSIFLTTLDNSRRWLIFHGYSSGLYSWKNTFKEGGDIANQFLWNFFVLKNHGYMVIFLLSRFLVNLYDSSDMFSSVLMTESDMS